jgi:peptidoglycan hydrolase CwlO-like protein
MYRLFFDFFTIIISSVLTASTIPQENAYAWVMLVANAVVLSGSASWNCIDDIFGNNRHIRLKTRTNHTCIETIDRVDSLQGTVYDLSNKLDALNTKMDAKFDAVDARFDKLEARFDKLEARFDKLEEQLQKLITILVTGSTPATMTDVTEAISSSLVSDHARVYYPETTSTFPSLDSEYTQSFMRKRMKYTMES